ncbi:hypothetical protein DFP96_11417 [Listeria rocourtiae]|uniref:Uncharacterized protein n=1 Tax=Listeria rocourtiae TaxID=647910 RepID=A0A4R6ZG09_9LIST|nr:hypothetical protein DFP96_11417 [Listeria rocourtiae]
MLDLKISLFSIFENTEQIYTEAMKMKFDILMLKTSY